MKRSFKRSFNKNDELFTPKCLVDVIVPYIKDYVEKHGHTIIWCPFDEEDSEFVINLSKLDNVEVVNSHIKYKQDFFEYEPKEWDIAVSNPPFSCKLDVFKRLFDFGKPFAMIMNIMAVNYQEIGELFYENPVQMLVPDKKVSFDGRTSSFCSGYICKDLLPRDLIFAHLSNNNSNQYFVPATHYRNMEVEKWVN